MKNFWDNENIEAIKRLIIPTAEAPIANKIKPTETIVQKALNEIGLNVNKIDKQAILEAQNLIDRLQVVNSILDLNTFTVVGSNSRH